MYVHIAHLSKTVSVGDTFKAGEVIGNVGHSGTRSSHLHFEVLKIDPLVRGVGRYTNGLSKAAVEAMYENPYIYLNGKRFPLDGGKVTGYDWLDWTAEGRYHPGLDINFGSGEDDYGMPILAPEELECIWTGYTPGWGNHSFFKQINSNNEPNDMDYVKKDPRICQETDTGAIYFVDHDTKEKFKFAESSEEEKAGVVALAKMAGSHMTKEQLKEYKSVERLALVG